MSGVLTVAYSPLPGISLNETLQQCNDTAYEHRCLDIYNISTARCPDDVPVKIGDGLQNGTIANDNEPGFPKLRTILQKLLCFYGMCAAAAVSFSTDSFRRRMPRCLATDEVASQSIIGSASGEMLLREGAEHRVISR